MTNINIVAVADALIVQAKDLERQAGVLRNQATFLYNECRVTKGTEITVEGLRGAANLLQTYASMGDAADDLSDSYRDAARRLHLEAERIEAQA